MEPVETQSEEARIIPGGLAPLFRVLSKQDTLRILFLAGRGITNSTHAIYELNLTQKKYYSRLSELVDTGLVKKIDGVYRQTGLGRMIYDRFLPAMVKVVDAREKLEFIVGLEGMKIENGVRRRILEELGIPVFENSTNVKFLKDYEAFAIAAIDIYDSADESVLLASNYIDVRVMEACFRSVDRGVTNRLIVDKKSLSSKMRRLRMMLSLAFAKTIISFASNKVELKKFVKFIDLPYTFCIVDGHRSIIEISDARNDTFIFALSFNDRVVGEKLTKLFDTLWKEGETNETFNLLDSIKSS